MGVERLGRRPTGKGEVALPAASILQGKADPRGSCTVFLETYSLDGSCVTQPADTECIHIVKVNQHEVEVKFIKHKKERAKERVKPTRARVRASLR